MKKTLSAKDFVVKGNTLIEARYRLNIQESNVILWLLNQIKPNDEDFKSHKMNIAEFAAMIGFETTNQYSKLRLVTKGLMRRILEINISEEETLQVAWLSSASYHHKKGYVSLCFDPKLKPYLLQLKEQFTKIDLIDTLQLKSIYSRRIFELLLQYLSIGKREMSIGQLRDFCGLEEDEYKLYGHLKSRVIDQAMQEINAKTEYEVNYDEIKDSRKVENLKWSIKKKSHFEKLQGEKEIIIKKEFRSENQIIDRLIGYGFSKNQAKKMIEFHGNETVSDAIKSVDIQVSRGNPEHPEAMMRAAIKEGYKPDVYKKKISK
jgi:plasmid replication initiation protein